MKSLLTDLTSGMFWFYCEIRGVVEKSLAVEATFCEGGGTVGATGSLLKELLL